MLREQKRISSRERLSASSRALLRASKSTRMRSMIELMFCMVRVARRLPRFCITGWFGEILTF